MAKVALITGITGQDGSYLAELLLSKGYHVHGIIRRASTFNTDRIDHIYQDPHEPDVRLHLHYGDLADSSQITSLVYEIEPDEVYHLGAQSHVRVSFDIPEYTGDITGLGTTRLLEAIRHADLDCAFYQASSSEMFGSAPPPQSEETKFHPRSPYAAAKVYAYWMTVNYREAHGLHASNGILFNHECVDEQMPLIVREGGIVDVVKPSDLVPLRRKGRSQQQFEVPDLEVWDGEDWTKVRVISATRRRTTASEHDVLSVEGRAGVVNVTAHHQMLRPDRSVIPAIEVSPGSRLAMANAFPEPPCFTSVTPDLARFLGFMTADGYVPERGTLQFTNNDQTLRQEVASLWQRLFLGEARTAVEPSGWNPDRSVHQLLLNGGRSLCEWLRGELYHPDGLKKVPRLILNASGEIQDAYLDAYYAGDGLKAGNGDSVKTNSPLLAQGLYWLYANQNRLSSVYVEHRETRSYYQLNVPTANPKGDKGQHLRKPPEEVRRTEPCPSPSDWVFDLETESGVFCAGVGRLIVHNSPRRGETFLTRKVSRAVARIRAGLQDHLYLGNLEAKRDWGFAPEYVEVMHRVLQMEEPGDYVVGTGETHSVREYVEEAFAYAGLDWEEHVRQDERYMRPSEVDLLIADPSHTAETLGWEARVDFRDIVRIMVDADFRRLGEEPPAEGERLLEEKFPDRWWTEPWANDVS